MQIIRNIRDFALTSPEIIRFSNLVYQITSKFSKQPINVFFSSEQAKFMIKQFQKLKISKICKSLQQLPQQKHILALSVLRNQNFSLILVIVPKNMKFDWHSHPHMFGITKNIFGRFRITSLDVNKLSKAQKNNCYIYPKKYLRIQQIDDKVSPMTIIYPFTYNIHKIQALEQSCFLDLLIPDYPDNYCDFYDTVGEDKDFIEIKELKECKQDIQDMNLILGEEMPKESFSSLIGKEIVQKKVMQQS